MILYFKWVYSSTECLCMCIQAHNIYVFSQFLTLAQTVSCSVCVLCMFSCISTGLWDLPIFVRYRFFFFFFFLSICPFLWLAYFLYLFLAAVGLDCCTQAFSSYSEHRLLGLQGAGFSLLWFLLLRTTGSRHKGSVVVAHRLSCPAPCGIFPDQGSNPGPLH